MALKKIKHCAWMDELFGIWPLWFMACALAGPPFLVTATWDWNWTGMKAVLVWACVAALPVLILVAYIPIGLYYANKGGSQ